MSFFRVRLLAPSCLNIYVFYQTLFAYADFKYEAEGLGIAIQIITVL